MKYLKLIKILTISTISTFGLLVIVLGYAYFETFNSTKYLKNIKTRSEKIAVLQERIDYLEALRIYTTKALLMNAKNKDIDITCKNLIMDNVK